MYSYVNIISIVTCNLQLNIWTNYTGQKVLAGLPHGSSHGSKRWELGVPSTQTRTLGFGRDAKPNTHRVLVLVPGADHQQAQTKYRFATLVALRQARFVA